MSWNMTTGACDRCEGDAREIIAEGDTLTFSTKDGVLHGSCSNDSFSKFWNTMRSVITPDQLPEPSKDSSIGYITIVDSTHPQGEAHVLVMQRRIDARGKGEINGYVRSLHDVLGDGVQPGPRSHNGFYHVPL